MRRGIVLLVVSLSLGCTSLNKKREKIEVENSQQLKQKEQQLLTTKTDQIFIDTGSTAMDVVFWPKGIVKYSPTNGFEGEAIQIAIRSKEKRAKVLNETKNQQLAANSELVFKQEQHSQVKTAQKNKKQLHFWLIGFLLALGICAAITYFYYKRKLF